MSAIEIKNLKKVYQSKGQPMTALKDLSFSIKQGELFEITEDYTKAEANYLKLIEFYGEDILADDSHYRLAKLYENKLGQTEKAKQYYEQIIFEFADSIYYVDARKRYRLLRGDEIDQ